MWKRTLSATGFSVVGRNVRTMQRLFGLWETMRQTWGQIQANSPNEGRPHRDSTPDPTLEDPDPQGLRTSGSVAVAVLFIALFNFGFCCCCWCCCRVLDSLNHPLSHRGRLGNRNNIGFPVMQPPPLAPAPVEMHAMGNQANRPQAPKATRNVVIVNPGGDIEIGVPDD